MIWEVADRAHPGGRVIADEHYNRQKIGATQFVPPGRCLVLLAPGALWVTSWPLPQFVLHAWPGAWMNSTFRREPDAELPIASELIRQAIAATRHRWPDPPPIGMITFVDSSKVRHKRDPGRCYLRAGFEHIGETKAGLLALQMTPDRMPAAEPAIGAPMELAI